MRAYSNMPTSEFVGQLRDIAIKAGARPQVIGCLDAIVDGASWEDVKAAEEDGYAKGFEAAVSAWHRARTQAALSLDDDFIGLAETQLEQVMEVIDRMEPEQ